MTDYLDPLFVRLALIYVALVFLAGVGVIQAAAAYNGLRGLLFLRRKGPGYALAAVLAGGPLALFFTWNERWETGVIQGVEQTALFLIGMAAALFVTLLLASRFNRRLCPPRSVNPGLAALRENTWVEAVKRFLGRQGDGLG
jgi:hypothetical protein